MGGDHIKSPEEIMTTITSLQALLNVADKTINNRTSELQRLENSIIDIGVEANSLAHNIEHMNGVLLLMNFNESVKYINRLSKKYFKMPLFKDTRTLKVLEVLEEHGIDYKNHPVDIDRLIYNIKHA